MCLDSQGVTKLGAFTSREESPSKITPGSLFKAKVGKKTDTTPLKGNVMLQLVAMTK